MIPVQKVMRNTILKLAWPVFLEMCGLMLSGIIMTAMVGQYGAVSLSAVALANMVQMAIAMIFTALGTGAAAIAARETGARNWQELRRVAGQGIMLGLLLGLFLAIFGNLLVRLIFGLVAAEREVMELAASLVRITFCAAPVYLVTAIGTALLRGIGRTPMALLVTITNNLTAVTCGYILIFGKGVPALQAYGAVWGAVCGQILASIAACGLMSYEPRIRLKLKDVFTWQQKVIHRIITVSVPTALEQIALQGGRIAFTFMLAGTGAVQFAAHEIALQIESLSFMPGFSFAVAAMTLVGQSLGKGLPQRAVQYARLSNQIAFWGMTVMASLFFIFARPLTELFITDPNVVIWGSQCVMIAALEQPTLAITLVYGGALRGAGDTRWPMYITTIGVWMVRVPFIYLFVVRWKYPVTAAWFVTAADYLVRSIILWIRFRSNKWSQL